MRTLLFNLLIVIGLIFVSCDKDDDLEVSQDEDVIELTTDDQVAIFQVRETNNLAIKNLDHVGVAEPYTEEFFILTSTNGYFSGKETVQGIYESVFGSRDEVNFIRTPRKITTNMDWNMASEHGNWVGTWKVDGAPIEVGGDYYAKWHKIDGNWKLRCEVYTQFDCSGEVVCSNKPSLD